jgi:hypothetical protein
MAAKREAVRQLPRLWCLKRLLGLAEVTPQKTEPAMIHLGTAHTSGTPAKFTPPPGNLHLDHPYLRKAPENSSADVPGPHMCQCHFMRPCKGCAANKLNSVAWTGTRLNSYHSFQKVSTAHTVTMTCDFYRLPLLCGSNRSVGVILYVPVESLCWCSSLDMKKRFTDGTISSHCGTRVFSRTHAF